MPRSSQRNRYVSSPTRYWLTLLNCSEFIEQKGKPHPAEVYISRCFILHSSCFWEAQQLPCVPWWAQGNYQWKPSASQFTFTAFHLFPCLGNLSHWHRWVSFRKYETLKCLNSSCRQYFPTSYLFPSSGPGIIGSICSFGQSNSFWEITH